MDSRPQASTSLRLYRQTIKRKDCDALPSQSKPHHYNKASQNYYSWLIGKGSITLTLHTWPWDITYQMRMLKSKYPYSIKLIFGIWFVKLISQRLSLNYVKCIKKRNEL
jgi:hypothetical protein